LNAARIAICSYIPALTALSATINGERKKKLNYLSKPPKQWAYPPGQFSRYRIFLNVIQSVPVLFTLNAADAILKTLEPSFLSWDFQKKYVGVMITSVLEALPTAFAVFPGLKDRHCLVCRLLVG